MYEFFFSHNDRYITSQNNNFSSWITLYKGDCIASHYGRCIKCKYKISLIYNKQNDTGRTFSQSTSLFPCENHSWNSARTCHVCTAADLRYWQRRYIKYFFVSRVELQTGNIMDCATNRIGISFPAIESSVAFIQHQFGCFEHSVFEFHTYILHAMPNSSCLFFSP